MHILNRLIIIITFLMYLANFAFSQGHLAPPTFDIQGGSMAKRRAVFVDILNAHYDLEFEKKGSVRIVSELTFRALDTGFPLFDLVPNHIYSMWFGKVESRFKILTTSEHIALPETEVPMRIILKPVKKDQIYTLKITHRIFPQDDPMSLIKRRQGVEFLFRFCDRSRRSYLERYLPANLQYDSYPIGMDIRLANGLAEHTLVTNSLGKQVHKLSSAFGKPLRLKFPHFYNSASPYFHLFPKDFYPIQTYRWKHVNVVAYSRNLFIGKSLKEFSEEIMDHLAEFDRDFGKFPYPFFIAFRSQSKSGIEHAGAAKTSPSMLRHEIFHSYFGRGAMPADGRASWIDEGLARWVDGGRFGTLLPVFLRKKYREIKNDSEKSVEPLGRISRYERNTPVESYSKGAAFFERLNGQSQGKFVNFLKLFAQTQSYRLYTEESFMNAYQHYLLELGDVENALEAEETFRDFHRLK